MESAKFVALVRTTGTRPALLLDALQSVALQAVPCLAIVIVHGDASAYIRVKKLCEEDENAPGTTVLHASDTNRRGGYPINAGLDYCRTQLSGVEFVFFLDDGDIVYPFFTMMMAAAFLAAEADVIYAASNRREAGRPAGPGYSPLAIHRLLRENFITINSYAIRAAALWRTGLSMSEDLDYTGDWHFLLRMLEAGLRFHAIPAALSEFRIISGGNVAEKCDASAWKEGSLQIRRYINATSFPIPGPDLANLNERSELYRDADQALISSLRDRIRALENSLSWKWTAPGRRLIDAVLAFRQPRASGAQKR